MQFKVDDRVVHPAHGVGRVVGLVNTRFFEDEARLYYEIAIERSTVWVPVDDGEAIGLRAVTRKADLARYRAVLRRSPDALTQDPRQRRAEVNDRLRAASFKDKCEVVRDLTAHGWEKNLNESDSAALRRAREGLCQEWAAAADVSVAQATAEIDALLQEARQAHEA